MATKSAAVPINAETFLQSQSACLTALFGYRDLTADAEGKLRVQIRYNAYREQSEGLVERWDGNKWQEVYRLPGGQLSGWNGSYYVQRGTPATSIFEADKARLLKRAGEVLGF